MPIYEYQCGTCQHQLEVLQKMSEPALTDCPACGAAALKKLMSASAFRLKGGGWYETDFKTGDKKNLAGEQGGKGSADKAGSDASAASPSGGDAAKTKSSETSSGKAASTGS